MDEHIKEARAFFCQTRSERWFEEERLAGGMGPEVEKGETRRCSLADVKKLRK